MKRSATSDGKEDEGAISRNGLKCANSLSLSYQLISLTNLSLRAIPALASKVEELWFPMKSEELQVSIKGGREPNDEPGRSRRKKEVNNIIQPKCFTIYHIYLPCRAFFRCDLH